MRDLTVPQLLATRHQLAYPSVVPAPDTAYKAANNFGPLPTALDSESWTPAEFLSRSFPYCPLPSKPPASVKPEDWDARVNHLLSNKLIHRSALPTLNMVKSWLTVSVPPYLQPPGDTPTEGRHHIPPEQVQMVNKQLKSPAEILNILNISGFR